MFALSMPSIAGLAATGGIVALAVAAVVVLGGGTFATARWLKNRKAAKQNMASGGSASKALPVPLPDLLGNLGAATRSPLVQEVLKVVLPAIHEAQQVAVNTAVAKMFPALTPFIPGIDKALLGLDTVIDSKLGIGGGAPAPQDSVHAPLVPVKPLVIPPGHPVLDLLQKVLEAHQQQQAKKVA